MQKTIYFDYNASTPIDPMVFESMTPYLSQNFGNPASQSHRYGWEANVAIEKARSQVAQLIGAESKEIIWTSGATESNNMVLFGVVHKLLSTQPEQKIEIITSQVEHKAILSPLEFIEKIFPQVTVKKARCDSYGRVSVEEIKQLCSSNTRLISVMAANNEVGTINPIDSLGQWCQDQNILFHSDAAQAVGKIEIDVDKMGLDFLSLSGHKMYGPKGIGALYVRDKKTLSPLLYGGSQEFGLRGGTVNVAGVVGLGQAAALCQEQMATDHKKIKGFFEQFQQEVVIPFSNYIQITGCLKNRLTHNIHLTFKNISPGLLKLKLSSFALSSGSACNSGDVESMSHVLKALGLSPQQANTALRISFGRQTTLKQVQQLIQNFKEIFSDKSNLIQ